MARFTCSEEHFNAFKIELNAFKIIYTYRKTLLGYIMVFTEGYNQQLELRLFHQTRI